VVSSQRVFLPLIVFDVVTDVVWPETKQIGVIDSIFRNFYIPPVIFGTSILCMVPERAFTQKIAVNQFEDGSETKTCIDGKQRLTSIYRCDVSVLHLGLD
jgi:hypothetical protein